MFPSFTYSSRSISLIRLLSILFLLSLPLFRANRPPIGSPTAPPNATWHALARGLLHATKGGTAPGVAALKSYLRQFGHLAPPPPGRPFTDAFDHALESALVSYQHHLGLPTTGRLDRATVRLLITPRCGVHDVAPIDGPHNHDMSTTTTGRFTYFHGAPRWRRGSSPLITLTYAFSLKHGIGYVGPPEVREAFARAFERWAAVIPVNFTETGDYGRADVRIGWYRGDHGDGQPFDGPLGVLAHAFSPEDGRLHLDGAERWAADLQADQSRDAVDLESVATHEIGHVLGLGHSPDRKAVMYPSLRPRTRKVELGEDDVAGIQMLYGPSPYDRYNSRLESDVSSGRARVVELKGRKGLLKWSAMVVFLVSIASFL